MNIEALLQQETWRFIDHSTQETRRPAIHSFSMDDTLCHTVGNGESPAVCRAWVHDKSVILGIQDTRLPFLDDGVAFLENLGYQVIIRNSGGLAVVLDDGILNVSLVLPNPKQHISIDSGYDAMHLFIQKLFADFPVKVEAGEIIGSYCPGSYDLSIGGKKFAGISQRRIKQGLAVQIYLCVHGSGGERATLIRDFYTHALQDAETKITYPEVNPNVMASLSELLGVELSNRDVLKRIYEVLKNLSENVRFSELSREEEKVSKEYFHRMIERNERFLV